MGISYDFIEVHVFVPMPSDLNSCINQKRAGPSQFRSLIVRTLGLRFLRLSHGLLVWALNPGILVI